jgi:hypothetical protein
LKQIEDIAIDCALSVEPALCRTSLAVVPALGMKEEQL